MNVLYQLAPVTQIQIAPMWLDHFYAIVGKDILEMDTVAKVSVLPAT